jgi:MerR family transcriptional regulator, light-induced transcriptional regulator
VSAGPGGLRMRDVVERTGVGEATLRAWETRYGFPEPQRLASGHRRYAEGDVELVRQVARLRDAGVPVPAAIERARAGADDRSRSVFTALRRERPELQVNVLAKRSLVAMSHAIEDECLCGADDLLLFAAFQRERHYRATEARWRELGRAAEAALVFADFPRARHPRGQPIEVPIGDGDPLAREWVLVCASSDRAACLAAWEPPGQDDVDDARRVFETIWTADRETTHFAGRLCCDLAAADARDVVGRIAGRLSEPVAPGRDDLRRAESLTSRMVAYVAGRPS